MRECAKAGFGGVSKMGGAQARFGDIFAKSHFFTRPQRGLPSGD